MTPKVTTAEVMLHDFSASTRLIQRLEALIEAPVVQVQFPLSEKTMANIEHYKDNLRKCVDELATSQENTLSLLKKIGMDNPDAFRVLYYRYIASVGQLTPWLVISNEMNFRMSHIYQLHRTGLDAMDSILAMEGENG